MDLNSPETWRWIWLVAAVVFAVGEVAVAGSFFLLPFALGATAAAVLGFADLSVGIEWVAFVGVSAATVAALRPVAKRLDRRTPPSGIGANRWVGRQGVVLRDIPAGHGATGLIRLEREEWRAESLLGVPIREGSTVLVSRVDGTRLVVVPLEELESPWPS